MRSIGIMSFGRARTKQQRTRKPEKTKVRKQKPKIGSVLTIALPLTEHLEYRLFRALPRSGFRVCCGCLEDQGNVARRPCAPALLEPRGRAFQRGGRLRDGTAKRAALAEGASLRWLGIP